MKLYSIALALLIPGSILAASEERRLVFEEVPTTMLFGVVQQAWAEATKTIPEPTGTVPGIYQELLEKGYPGFCAANPAIVQRTFEILDHFKPDSACTCCQPKTQELIRATANAFTVAARKPKTISRWVTECYGFSAGVMLMATQNSKNKNFKARIMTLNRIIDNNGIEGTPEERIEIAAHMLAITARFNERFVAMQRDKDTFAAFCKRLPEIFEKLKAANLEN